MPYTYNPLLDAGLDQTGSSNPGDITAVTAGTGLSGGGTSGDVTLSLANTASSGQVLVQGASGIVGDADLTYNTTTNALTIGGDVTLNDGGSFTTTLQTITPTANRTVSLPDATGTVALVAGSSGQLLWNNAGANAGASTLTYDGSILTTSGRFINSYNATASAPAKTFTGTWFTGGTATTTKPQVLIEPTGTTSTAWSTSGTGLGVNAASGFAGNLLDLQVNGTSQLRVSSAGIISRGSTAQIDFNSNSAGRLRLQSNNANGGMYINGLDIHISQGGFYGWDQSGSPGSGTCDLTVFRDAANTLAQRNGTSAQTFRVYNTFTDASNYERLSTTWSSNVCYTKPENAGTGSARLYVPVTGSTTVASLPSASTAGAGARAFVTDANATTFLSTVAGGGANKVPVVSDGTNWLIG